MKNFKIRRLLHIETHKGGLEVDAYSEYLHINAIAVWRKELVAFVHYCSWVDRDFMVEYRRGIFTKRRLGI